MAYTISFDYMRDRDYFRDEKAVQAKKEKIANDALARLKKGDSFEKVAKDLSEDGMSDPEGGTLECIRADSWTRKCRRSWARWSPASSAR